MKYASASIGARGHVGAELIRLIAAHPQFELAFVSSRELVGQAVADHIDGVVRRACATNLAAKTSRGAASMRWCWRLPNGKAAFVAAVDANAPDTVMWTCPPITGSMPAGTTACRS